MSHAANPNKQKKEKEESEAAVAARQEKADKEKIRRLIITLGDDNKKVMGQIRGLTGALEEDVELHGELMASTVLECATHLPLKSTIYAAWVARMTTKHDSWASSVVEEALASLQAGLRIGDLATCQMVLRFIVCLGSTGTLGLSAVMALLKEVLALSDGLRSAKGGDLGVFLALSALPFLSAAAHAKVTEEVDSIISRVNAYIESRDARWKTLLRIRKSDELPDRLEALLNVVQALKKSEWSLQTVFHVPGVEPSMDGHAGMPPLTPLGVTAEDIKKSKIRIQIPLVTCHVLRAAGEKRDPEEELSLPDQWVLEDYILLTLDRFGRDVEECCKQLLKIPIQHDSFEAVLVETIFSQMLRLPTPQLLPLFYSRLLETMVEKQSSTRGLIDRAYQTLFESAADLDEESLEVLSEAFAYQLMRNGCKADWTPFTGDDAGVQAQRVLRRALEKLLRLSFHQNLLHRLPEAVHVYVPPEPLAATNLPAQEKPEFARMVSFAKIKDPDVEKVITYCQRLLKVQAKEEPEDGSAAVDGAALPVSDEPEAKRQKTDGDGAGADKEGAEKEASDDKTEPDSKRARTEEDGTPAEDDKKTKDDERAKQFSTVTSFEGTKTTQVKEEIKEEDKSGSKNGADAVSQEDTEFGKVPDEPWSLDAVAELLAVTVMQNGSKTPTHMSKMLDGYVKAFLSLRPSDTEAAHNFTLVVVKSIFDFWRYSGQRLEITLESLLQRGIVTPKAVVEQALAQRGAQGSDSMAVWNLINSVARRSLENSQSIRADLAIAKRLGKTDVVDKCKREMDQAIRETAELFTLIFTSLVRNHQDYAESDAFLRKITLDRVLTIGRKYHAFIKPLIEAADQRIPGVAHNPEVAAIFDSLGAL